MKLMFLCIVSLILIVNVLYYFNMKMLISLTYLHLANALDMPFYVSWKLTFIVFFFLLMLSFVSCLICVYSELYMEDYKFKKFSFLMVIFIFSMVLLSLSGNFFTMIIGWEGLGMSSIMLVIFYPNFNSSYNCYHTMLFNRLGDIFFLILLGLSLESSFNYFYVNNYSIILFLMICSLTKSAQFPVSSWLPAAMSAPTPISALVHSSTLVTAGLFLIICMLEYFNKNILTFLLILSGSSFIFGGLLSCLESDLKKTIAFSTMSQISMIMVLCCCKFLYLACLHMILHAAFKSVLFSSAGIYFAFGKGEQKDKSMSNNMSKIVALNLFLTIFSMTGILFSSSFYTKDLVLEILLNNCQFSFFFLFIIGSILTLLYSIKLLKSIKMKLTENFSAKKNKKFQKKIFETYIYLILMTSILTKTMFPLEKDIPVMHWEETTLTLILLTLPILMNIKVKLNAWLPMKVGFMKFFSFELLNYFEFKKSKFILISEQLFLMKKFINPIYFKATKNQKKSKISIKFLVVICTAILLT